MERGELDKTYYLGLLSEQILPPDIHFLSILNDFTFDAWRMGTAKQR